MTNIIETTKGIRCGMCGVVNWPTAMSCMNCTATLDKRAQMDMLAYPVSGEMTFSRSLARFFEVIDYILLVPASYGMLLVVLMGFNAPLEAKLVALVMLGWFIAGCFLLRGFFRHSRGRLSDSEIRNLWLATIGYNLVDLIITCLIARSSSSDMVFLYFALWPLLVIIFSAMALWTERQRVKTF
jgi:hypothetical protein